MAERLGGPPCKTGWWWEVVCQVEGCGAKDQYMRCEAMRGTLKGRT